MLLKKKVNIYIFIRRVLSFFCLVEENVTGKVLIAEWQEILFQFKLNRYFKDEKHFEKSFFSRKYNWKRDIPASAKSWFEFAIGMSGEIASHRPIWISCSSVQSWNKIIGYYCIIESPIWGSKLIKCLITQLREKIQYLRLNLQISLTHTNTHTLISNLLNLSRIIKKKKNLPNIKLKRVYNWL